MRTYSRAHLNDHDLLDGAKSHSQQDRATTAELLADIAEIDSRRLFLPAGFPSMLAYCVSELRLFDQAAKKRIRAARTALRFPAIFPALAEGRLHLSAIVMLKPYLTSENAGELLSAAENQTKSGIEMLIAERFPSNEMLPLVETIPAPPRGSDPLVSPGTPATPAPTIPAASKSVDCQRSTVKPLARQRYALHLSIGQRLHDKLRHAQDLLSHQVPSGDVPEVLERALDELIAKLEKRKFAATVKPRSNTSRSSANPRHISAHVRKAVWERDQGQCTFVAESGRRCGSRQFLEYDHTDPVARGGQSTVENVRLRCSAHNQLEAERTFGAGFMEEKREEARRAAEAKARARAEAKQAVAAEAEARAIAQEHAKDVMCGLRNLGFRADQARRAAEYTATLSDATLEDRLRAALKFLCPKRSVHVGVDASTPMPT
jgi:5-methylcytosine-specific restriction endonuclease McrA